MCPWSANPVDKSTERSAVPRGSAVLLAGEFLGEYLGPTLTEAGLVPVVWRRFAGGGEGAAAWPSAAAGAAAEAGAPIRAAVLRWPWCDLGGRSRRVISSADLGINS